MTENIEIKELYEKYLEGNASREEYARLVAAAGSPQNQALFHQLMETAWHEIDPVSRNLEELEALNNIQHNEPETEKILQHGVLPDNNAVPGIIRFIKSKPWLAAAVMILIAGAVYLLVNLKPKIITSEDTLPEIAGTPDIKPAGNRAILAMANGRKIALDSARTGELAKLGNTTVAKTASGKLIYQSIGGSGDQAAGMNTLSTPRGGIYQITLPDGTIAWLNAASSITYPTRFNEKIRKVSITGEVYFEVASLISSKQHTKIPFEVQVASPSNGGDGTVIEVLGTHFNVNAYADNEDGLSRTTLLEGSVKVSQEDHSIVLKPGEQAVVSLHSTYSVNYSPDLEAVMAWKNGKLMLTNSTLKQVMQQISRWYDVDIVYQETVPEKGFTGILNRNLPLSNLLHALDAYGVKTKLYQKTIIVQ